LTGKTIRLEKLFSGGNAVVVAIDHGEFDGPIPAMEDLPRTAAKINPAVDGILLSPGMIERCWNVFAKKGAPVPIVRLNWSTAYCFQWGYSEAETVEAASAGRAAAAGAEAVLVSLALKTGSERRDGRNVEVFCRLAGEAVKLGLPVIGEYFPPGPDALSPEEMHEQVKIGCRIVAELGADAVKTFYTVRFREVTEGCPVPVLGLGAEKLPTELDALRLARRQIDDGARGVVFGRNAVSWPHPARFQAALIEVVRNGKGPEEAAKEQDIGGG
jgi:DhnA family fructose-bisphosphate aldolase class Ia